MATKVKVIVLTGYGINCEREMAYASRLAGADQVDIVHLSDLLHGVVRLDGYHFLNLPGGFLDGDNLGSAQVGAHRLKYARVKGTGERLMDQLLAFVKGGGLILGVCNGFQLLVKAGLLPGFGGNYEERVTSLTYNDSGRFEDRWVTCRVVKDSPCIFTKGLDSLELPVRHGEGKFVTLDRTVRDRLVREGLVAMQYVSPITNEPTDEYPYNPNGSELAVAGVCDPSGRIFGMMPHPEAFNHRTNHPEWTRRDIPEEGAGIAIFRNAVEYIRENL
ncbi:MAG: phosphoribosylformylglycinamidine synthase subunit PurQ [Dissulfurimicrobium sp.]|uniref:phosphoribosylformylglycinamidine synthase subunit PurQ n=1 Tax=Dissulfurimicrobium sp. TaxID=2022436 RepID=UPI00404985F4